MGHINLCWAGFPWAASVCVTGKKSEIPASISCFFSQHWALLGKDGEGNGVPTASTSFPLSSGENSTLQGPAVPLMRYVNQGRDLRFPAVSLHYYIYIHTHTLLFITKETLLSSPFHLHARYWWELFEFCSVDVDWRQTHIFSQALEVPILSCQVQLKFAKGNFINLLNKMNISLTKSFGYSTVLGCLMVFLVFAGNLFIYQATQFLGVV